ncbi:MAG: hypothetical protein HYT41_01965 [Candidatus Sungbacteria bacterium]|nr:hypothetical protein [Candidatus Sungbacteria bacterium]
MATEQKILDVVVGDAGACLDLVPAVLKLQQDDVIIRWHVDPSPLARASRVLDQSGIPYDHRGPSDEHRGHGSAKVLVGTSTKAIGLQLEWTGWASEYGESAWYDDLFVNSCRRDVMGACPDRIFCINGLAQNIVHKLRPGVPTAIVGKPSFGVLPSVEEVAATRKRIRAKYGLNEGDFLVTFGFAGEPAERAWAQLEQIMTHRSLFVPDTVFAFRFHPAHPRAGEMWRRVAESGLKIIDARAENLLDLYIASNAVATDYVSTDPYKLLCMGMPVVTMLFPDDLPYRNALGYLNGVPPILMGRAGFFTRFQMCFNDRARLLTAVRLPSRSR